MAQTVKNLSAIQDTRVQSLCPEDPPGGGPSFNIRGLAIPHTSRNYLHFSVPESDLYLVGIETDE